MKWAVNFYLWFSVAWSITLLLYSFGWSELNQPLTPSLRTFLFFATVCSFAFAALHARRDSISESDYRFTSVPWSEGWPTTVFLVAGFAADFRYRGQVPFLSGTYEGYDSTVDVQDTVGIPIFHVMLISVAIFQAIRVAGTFASTRRFNPLVQFLIVQALFILNNSRGYIAYSVIGGVLLMLASAKTRLSHIKVRHIIGILFASLLLVFVIGAFGNLRYGYAWNDSSFIDSIGQYNRSFPRVFDSSFKWTYTYATSPLANLNFNVISGGSSLSVAPSHLLAVLLAFVPETFSKTLVTALAKPLYEVSYLNAVTGYTYPYLLAGGVRGLYIAFAIQMLLLEAGYRLAHRIGGIGRLYGASASIMMIVLIFYNSFWASATAFLPLLVLLYGVFRKWRRRVRARELPRETLLQEEVHDL